MIFFLKCELNLRLLSLAQTQILFSQAPVTTETSSLYFCIFHTNSVMISKLGIWAHSGNHRIAAKIDLCEV